MGTSYDISILASRGSIWIQFTRKRSRTIPRLQSTTTKTGSVIVTWSTFVFFFQCRGGCRRESSNPRSGSSWSTSDIFGVHFGVCVDFGCQTLERMCEHCVQVQHLLPHLPTVLAQLVLEFLMEQCDFCEKNHTCVDVFWKGVCYCCTEFFERDFNSKLF